MTEQEFRDKYNSLLKEFHKRYKASDRLRKQFNKEEFVKELEGAKTPTEQAIIIATSIEEIEADRTNQLIGFMLEHFLDIKD